ncbi:MAG TPA: C4-type zinc ribbon domain-containing protein, partial [Blastocatellia bacterium]|nr:C4-type zinc ribbon domain-containing protein [Blastocatellia bacterium]
SQLIELQELDLELHKLNDRLAKIPSERDQIESGFRQYAAEFLELKDRYDKTLDDRKQLETELASAQEHHDKFEQDKMRVTNPKQYEAVVREIDANKKQISAFESEILKRMEEADRLDAEIKERTPDVERKRQEADQALAAFDAEREAAEQQIAALNERRQQIAAQVSKPLFAAYDRLARSRRGQALSPISSEGICSVCRVRVRPKVFSDVRRGDQMITCENCGRILYYKSESTVEAAG